MHFLCVCVCCVFIIPLSAAHGVQLLIDWSVGNYVRGGIKRVPHTCSHIACENGECQEQSKPNGVNTNLFLGPWCCACTHDRPAVGVASHAHAHVRRTCALAFVRTM